MMTFFIYALTTILVLCSLLLTGVVLLQRPRSEGLGSAFGGGMTESMFGAGTSDVLSRFTIWMAGAFFLLTILLAILMSHRDGGQAGVLEEKLKAATEETAPADTTVVPDENEPQDATPTEAPAGEESTQDAENSASTPAKTE